MRYDEDAHDCSRQVAQFALVIRLRVKKNFFFSFSFAAFPSSIHTQLAFISLSHFTFNVCKIKQNCALSSAEAKFKVLPSRVLLLFLAEKFIFGLSEIHVTPPRFFPPPFEYSSGEGTRRQRCADVFHVFFSTFFSVSRISILWEKYTQRAGFMWPFLCHYTWCLMLWGGRRPIFISN